MKTLLLIPPPETEELNVVRDVLYGCWCKGNRIGGAKAPPLSILSVATVLYEDGNDIRLLDAPEEKINLYKLKEIVKDYDFVVLLTSTMTFNDDAKILLELKNENKKLKTIVFGSHPTFMPQYCLGKGGIDIVVKKEPEFIIRDLLRAFRNNKDWKKIKGIGYKENGIKINEDYPFIKNLDDLPICNRDLLPKNIEYYNPLIKRYPYTTSETSRGCPGLCSFCTAPKMYGKMLRWWTSKKVIEEIELLKNKGYKEIYYRDETFSAFPKRNLEVFDYLKNNKIDLKWICNIRVGSINRDDLKLMGEARCHYIKVGVESGVQDILDKSRKGIRIEDTIKLFKWADEFGIKTHAHLMLGMPGENKETIKQTIKFVKKINPSTIDIGICTPYPGSELFENVAEKYPEIMDGTDVNLKNLHTTGLFNELYTDLKKDELEKNLQNFYKQFYINPKHIFKNVSEIKDLNDFKRTFKASLNLLSFMIKKGD